MRHSAVHLGSTHQEARDHSVVKPHFTDRDLTTLLPARSVPLHHERHTHTRAHQRAPLRGQWEGGTTAYLSMRSFLPNSMLFEAQHCENLADPWRLTSSHSCELAFPAPLFGSDDFYVWRQNPNAQSRIVFISPLFYLRKIAITLA